jgi:hypothetical protein
MAVVAQKPIIRLARVEAFVEKSERRVRRSSARPCMVVSVGLVLAGMGVVVLMVLGFLPLTFLMAFLGFALTAVGGVMALIFCGEI